jgi:UDP-GlcNAc:undecaprenyl-phosphate GlcNAc-1-phosphate transferase
MIAVYTTVLALFIAITLVPLLARWAGTLGLIDDPGPRKIHDHAIPRIGGIAIAAGAMVSVLVWVPMRPEIAGYLIGALFIVLFGVADDRLVLNYRFKFAAQIVGALLFVIISDVHLTRAPFVYGVVMPGWLGLPLTLVVLVAITNAVNLSDGMDGLAGGTSLFAAAALGYLAYDGGDKQIALVALGLVGATLGFLRYNTFPARVFMGDAGSQFLGFSVAALAILVIEQANNSVSPFVPVLLLGLPILDTLYVMTRRIRAGVSPFTPDRQHLHHRLLDAGLSQYEALLVVYGLQTVLIGLAWSLRYANDVLLLVVFVTFSTGLLYTMRWWQTRQTEGRALAHRLDIVDRVVRLLKAKSILARTGHGGVVYGVSSLFPLVALWVDRVPPDLGWLGLLLVLLLGLTPFRLFPRLGIYRVVAFVTSALVIYFIESTALGSGADLHWLRSALLLIAVCLAIWLRFGDEDDFRLNALDVLVILIVAVVPNMPLVRDLGVGSMVIGMLLLFYASEMILSEQPARWWVFRFSLLITSAVLAVRGIAFP